MRSLHALPVLRRIGAGVATAALASGSALALAAPASAAPSSVDGVSLTWALNDESGGGAYFGGCNFLTAGLAGDTGSSRLWTEADGFYKPSEGNVSIEKNSPAGYVAPTWATKCQNPSGSGNVTPQPGSTTANRAVFAAGTGQVDVEAGTAQIAWEGDLTIVFYGGLTYWSVSDPELTVAADGTGTLTGTASGYGTSMEDMSQWVPLAPEEIVLADLSGVEVTAQGLTVTPDYAGVEVSGEGVNQVRTGSAWGAFPQSFVDFNGKTGQAAYWYSSGGAADPKKPAKPIDVAWEIATTPEPEPEPEPGDGEVPIEVEVPVVTDPEPEPEPGALSWTINGTSAVSLGRASASDAGFSATGSLHAITVSDTRTDGAGWSLSGRASDFASAASSFSASALGWAPAATGTAAGLQAGPAVSAGSGAGLSEQRTLASATGAGQAEVATALTLLAPTGTAAGAYTSTLTLTALG
ncbi:hypothetical protein [Litorihabitans aurantiacus]|uniref:Htaa domain-containing protein n=1 Tax=Litorihabitans aurantiacus TaxID=1930061 RepID=A0AA37XFX1_9MICO|nr:hypothetical protein [Litorihabitans aurantiacus]GMA32773.1 hypothetical protein GCM10025875_27650 [Litorihabitans aurantiacus]